MELSETIAEDSLPLTLVALLGRGVGMMVPLVVARWFGADAQSDAFYLALTVPMFAEALLATALHGTLGPLYAKAKAQGPEASSRFLGGSILVIGGLLMAISLILATTLPAALSLLSPDRAPLAIEMLHPLLLAIPLIGINISLGTSLDLRGHFLIPAWLPAIKALAYLTTAGILRADLGIHALPIGFILGELGQLLWLIFNIWRKRVPIGFGLGGTLRELTAAIALFIPIALGDLAVHINAFVDRGMAAGLGDGALTALEYADRTRVIPEALVGAGLLRVAFAYWANAYAEGNIKDIQGSFERIAGWTWTLLVPSAATLILLRLPIVNLLYGGAAFGPESVQLTAETLAGYLPGVPIVMVGLLALQVLWIRGDLKLVAAMGFISAFSNFIWDLALLDDYGAPGLAAATSINQGVVALVFLVVLGRRMKGVFTGRALGMGVLYGLGIIALGWGLHRLLGPIGPDILRDIPKILVVLSVMAAVTLGSLWRQWDGDTLSRIGGPPEDSEGEEPPPPPRLGF